MDPTPTAAPVPAPPTAFSMDTDAAASTDSTGKADRLKVRLAHPKEGSIIALLDSIASGDVEDLAGAASQAKALLCNDGIFIVHSTKKIGGERAGEHFVYDGKVVVPLNQFTIWVRDPDGEDAANAPKGNKGMIYRSWRDGRSGPRFMRKFLDHSNVLLQTRLGLAGNEAPSTDLPTGTAAPGDRSAETDIDEDLD